MGRRSKARNRTRVFVVQDKSGSMNDRRAETISGFNEYVDTLDEQAEGEVLLSLIQFDTTVHNVFVNKSIEDVEDLSPSDFVPGGMTALRDGVGRAISLAEKSVGEKDKVLVVIMTDGGENSSREYTHEAILKQIEGKRKDGWEFVFMGAGEEAWNAGRLVFGGAIPDAHVLNYSAIDHHDHQRGYSMIAASTVNLTRGGTSAFDAGQKGRLEDKAKAELRK